MVEARDLWPKSSLIVRISAPASYGFLYEYDGRLKDSFKFLGYEPPDYDLVCDSFLFSDVDADALRKMSNWEIECAYLSDNMDKLVAMLRLGHNYIQRQSQVWR